MELLLLLADLVILGDLRAGGGGAVEWTAEGVDSALLFVARGEMDE